MNEHSQVLTKPLNYWKTREIDELMQFKKRRSDLNGKKHVIYVRITSSHRCFL